MFFKARRYGSASRPGFGVLMCHWLPLQACWPLAGLLTMYSSGYDHGTRFEDHARNMLIAGLILFGVAQVPPQRLMDLALPLYVLGVGLLVAVALFGLTKRVRSAGSIWAW